MDNLLSEARSPELAGGHDRSVEEEGSEDTDTAAMHWSEVYCGWSTGKLAITYRYQTISGQIIMCQGRSQNVQTLCQHIPLFFLVWVHNIMNPLRPTPTYHTHTNIPHSRPIPHHTHTHIHCTTLTPIYHTHTHMPHPQYWDPMNIWSH